MDQKEPLIRLDNISLRYGNVSALKSLSLAVGRGEIHALVGEHGAGKSSIINILGGLARPDSGSIVVNGRSYRSFTVQESQNEGISLVKQGVCLCDHLSVASNIYMNQPAFFRRHGLNKRLAEDSVVLYLESHGVRLETGKNAGSLKLADKVLTEIMRALYREPKVLILDESLEKLTAEGLERVIATIREMRDTGKSILFVTHRVDDIFQIADRVTVIRQGEVLITESVDEIDKFSLVKMAYTQLPVRGEDKNGDIDFYHLLKYNQAILENLPINLLVVNNELELKLINTQAADYFAIPGGANPGISLKQIFEGNADLYGRIENRIGGFQTTTLFNEQFRTADQLRILNISIVPIRDESWQIGSILMIEDATEREKLREQIFLSEKIGSIGVLASGIAHEICNPLEIISNDIAYLKTLYGESIDLSILQEIKEEVESITRIVRNLDRLPGQSEPAASAVSISALAKSVVTFVSPVAEQCGVAIDLVDASNGGTVEARMDDLRQVLLNLIKNALEATDDGGRVEVELRKNDQSVEIHVVDDGPGIAEEDRNHIFLPFFSTKESSRVNRGLGLYVSYQLTTRNRGTIHLDSSSTGGCSFVLRFPAV